MCRSRRWMRAVLAAAVGLVLAGCHSFGSGSSERVVLEPAFFEEISGARSVEEAVARLDRKCDVDPTISDSTGCQTAVREFLGGTPITLTSQAGPVRRPAGQGEDLCRAGMAGGRITLVGGTCVPAFHLVDAQNKPLDPAAVPPDGRLPAGFGIARDAVPPAPNRGAGGERQPGEPDPSGPPGGDPAFLRPVSSANYPDFNKFEGAENLAQAVSDLFEECNRIQGDRADAEPPESPIDMGECKMAALQRLALSEIRFEDVDASESGELKCSPRWEEGKKKGEGKIVITTSNREECSKRFPGGRDDRISTVSGAAYQYDRDEALGGGTDLATTAARLFAFCDANLGGVDPETCRKEQEELLRTATFEPTPVNEGEGCNARIDHGREGLVILVNTQFCEPTAFPAGPPSGSDDTARETAITEGRNQYENARPTTLAGLVSAMYADCEKRTDDPRDEDVASCYRTASTLATEAPYEFVDGEGDACRATWDSTRSHIVLTGNKAACQQAFPDEDTDRSGAVEEAGTAYQQAATLRDVTDLTSAAKTLHALCDSGQSENPATCREKSDALLKAVKVIVRDGADCRPDVSSDGGRLAVTVGPDCGAAFPVDPAAQAEAVNKAGKEYTEAQQTALRGATDLASATTALYALCDSGKSGKPAACKEQSDALLAEVPIVRTEDADCTADVSSEGGKLALVVGKDCGAAFPDDPAAREDAVQKGTEQYVPPAKAPVPADPDQPAAPPGPVPGDQQPPEKDPPANNGPDKGPPANNGPDKGPPANNGPDKGPPANNGPDKGPPANNGPDKGPPANNGPDKGPPANNGPDKGPPANNGPDKDPPANNGSKKDPPADNGSKKDPPADNGSKVPRADK